MRIIIAGDGKVGASITKQLCQEGNDLTLIDTNVKVLSDSIERYDVMSVNGNCATTGTLREAGVEEADLLIAATSADEINLLCCMTAHALNPKLHTIARIRNPEYTEQIYEMREAFGLSLTVNPERMAAEAIARLLQFPGFLKRETFAKDRVEIVELKIVEKGKLDGVSLMELNSIVHCRVLVCVVLRDGTAIMPSGDFVLRANDRIFVTAPTHVLATLVKNLGIQSRKTNKVLIAGGGRISFYLAQMLEKNHMSVQIIERDMTRCRELAELLPNTDIVNGDASDQMLLDSEGIKENDAVVALTGLDELNMIISLFANSQNVPQAITKLGHTENSTIFNQLPIGSIVSPKELCCNTIVRYVRAIQNQSGAAISVHSIAYGQAEATEFLVDEKTQHLGEPLKRLTLRKNVLLVSITRNGETELPNGDSILAIGDTVIVVTNAQTVLMKLNDIFQ